MQLAEVIGHATATVKHASLAGWKLLVVQPLDASGGDDGDPLVAIDLLGSGRGDRVMLTTDGVGIRRLIGTDHAPVRYAVVGIDDGDRDANR